MLPDNTEQASASNDDLSAIRFVISRQVRKHRMSIDGDVYIWSRCMRISNITWWSRSHSVVWRGWRLGAPIIEAFEVLLLRRRKKAPVICPCNKNVDLETWRTWNRFFSVAAQVYATEFQYFILLYNRNSEPLVTSTACIPNELTRNWKNLFDFGFSVKSEHLFWLHSVVLLAWAVIASKAQSESEYRRN